MRFEWGELKNKANIKKHGIAFTEAEEIFDDPFQINVLDKRFSYSEERWITLGVSQKGKLIVVGHLYDILPDGEEIIRIITARAATKKEKERYEKLEG